MSYTSANTPDSEPVTTQQEYIAQLERHLLRLLAGRVMSFCELVRECGGAYPADVRDVLEGLLRQPKFLGDREAAVVEALRPPAIVEFDRDPRGDAQKSGFGDPHPADYDWRFGPETREELVNRLAEIVQSGDTVAIFGAPTLVPTMTRLQARTTLIDRSQSAIADLERLRVRADLMQHDLFRPIRAGVGSFAAVVADPPWYPAYHRAFILRAAQTLQRQGLLFVSVLPWLTRPQAIQDRKDIIVFAHAAGFDLAEIAPEELSYESPKFERYALAAEGLSCGNWRRGDLFVFRRVRDPRPDLIVEPPADEPEWDEFIFDGRRVKLRRRAEASKSPLNVRQIRAGSPILNSVSRRCPLRASIDLWTSDNVAYAIDRLDVVRDAVTQLAVLPNAESVARQAARDYSLTDVERQKLQALLQELLGRVTPDH